MPSLHLRLRVQEAVLCKSLPHFAQKLALSGLRWPQPEQVFRSVIMGPWKLIHSRYANHPSLLFNTRNDPGETDNVIAAHPEVVKGLTRIIEAVKKRAKEGGDNAPLDLSEEEIRVLEALGYTGK